MEKVKLYDTTLRDGMQGQGMSLSAAEKVRVVHALDRLGVHYIEAGFPASNPKEAELFSLLAKEDLSQARICAFGMTRRRGVAVEEDESLRLLAETFAPVVTLVGKTWSLHLKKVTKVSPEENLAMIEESVRFLTDRGKQVIYDAEHFFDAWREDDAYSLDCLNAAVAGGAVNLTLCDTNGSSLPDQIGDAVAGVAERLGPSSRAGNPHAQRCRVRRRQLARRGPGGCPSGAGHCERIRRALWQRKPGLDPAGAPAEDGL